MGGLQWWHIVLIVVAFIILFGARKLPDAARGVGRSLRILKSEVSAMHDDDAAAKAPAETDASAAYATPQAQITGTPAAAPIAQAPGTPVAVPAPVAPAVAPSVPVAQPVAPANGSMQVRLADGTIVNAVPVSPQNG